MPAGVYFGGQQDGTERELVAVKVGQVWVPQITDYRGLSRRRIICEVSGWDLKYEAHDGRVRAIRAEGFQKWINKWNASPLKQ